jgi:hypothetical protein
MASEEFGVSKESRREVKIHGGGMMRSRRILRRRRIVCIA